MRATKVVDQKGADIEEICEEEECIYFISTDFVVGDVSGEEDHDGGDSKTGLLVQQDTHPGTLKYSLLSTKWRAPLPTLSSELVGGGREGADWIWLGALEDEAGLATAPPVGELL